MLTGSTHVRFMQSCIREIYPTLVNESVRVSGFCGPAPWIQFGNGPGAPRGGRMTDGCDCFTKGDTRHKIFSSGNRMLFPWLGKK